MKRSIFILFLTAVLAYSICAFSVLVGNPVGFPDEKAFTFGGEYWDVSSKDVIVEYDDNIKRELTTQGKALKLSYGLSDVLCLDLRIGQAEFDIDEFYTYDEGTMWGLGTRAVIFRSQQGITLMGGFQYNNYSPENAEISGIVLEPDADGANASVDISKCFADRINIYGGIQYSYLTFKYYHDGEFGQREGGYEQENEVGYYGGVDLMLLGGLSLFAEGHFSNEDAYIIGIVYKMTGKELAPEGNAPAAPPEEGNEGIFAGRFHVSGELSRFTDKKMTEEDGFVPEYDKYRMSSDRMFAVFSYDLIDRISVFTKLGNADLETHSSEGETTSFDSEFAYAIGSRGKLFEIAKDVWLSAEISYLNYSPEDEETISTTKYAYNTGGDVSIEWSEVNASIDLSKRAKNTLLFGGVELLDVTAEQDRRFADGTVSSTFEAEDNVGIFAGFQYWLTESFSVSFRADIITQRQYTFGGAISF